ncbi:MAG: nucleotidyltransferase family protein [Cyanobacteriota bacterium]
MNRSSQSEISPHLLTLDPVDHLLLILAHASRWDEAAPIRWVADAVLLIRAVDHFNWPRFVSLAKDRRLTAPAGALLAYLQGQMAMEVPAAVLAELAAATGSDDIQRLTMRSRPDVSGGGEELLYLLRRWRRLRQDQTLRGKVPGLMRFMCHILGIPSRRELVQYGLRESRRRRA